MELRLDDTVDGTEEHPGRTGPVHHTARRLTFGL